MNGLEAVLEAGVVLSELRESTGEMGRSEGGGMNGKQGFDQV
jgi:hypothetical protein